MGDAAEKHLTKAQMAVSAQHNEIAIHFLGFRNQFPANITVPALNSM